MTYKIEKGVPMPFRDMVSGRAGSPYPYREMEHEDCFFVSTQGKETLQQVSSRLRTAVSSWNHWGAKQTPKRRFATRSMPAENKVGVWCLFGEEKE